MEEEDDQDEYFDQLATGHDFDVINEMLSTDEFIHFPIHCKTFKNILRNDGIPSNSLRRLWWPVYFFLLPDKELQTYPEITKLAFKKYYWAIYQPNQQNSLIDLSWGEDSSENITYSVMKLLVQHYDIQDPGLIHPLVQQLSKILTNKAICYYVLTEIIERSTRYLIATPFSHRCKLHAFRELARRCMVHTHHLLEKMGALEEEYLNLIFVDMFTTILPNDYVNSIMDVYLYDGVKVLYRYGLALFKLHKRKIKAMEYKSGEEFWTAMRKYQKNPETFDFVAFHNFAFDRCQNVLKTKIVPPRATIHEYELAAQQIFSLEELTSPLNLPYELSLSSIEDIRSLLHTKSKILDLFMARRLHSYLPQTIKMEGFQLYFATSLHGWNLNTLYSLVEGRYPCLIIIKSVEIEAVIGAFITTAISPPSNSIKGDGGCFIFRLDGPTGLCSRWALLNHQQHAMITIQSPPTSSLPSTASSPILSSPLNSPTLQQPSQFSPNTISTTSTPSTTNNTHNNTIQIEMNSTQDNTIDAPSSLPELTSQPSIQSQQHHQHQQQQQHHFPLIAKSKSLQLLEPNTHLGCATFHQFIHCTVDYLAIGGSHKHGTNAIRLTSDLMLCSCGHSDTFNNKSLTTDEPSDPWYVSDIEVYCGQHYKKK